jgi:hypothetical protein
MGKVEYKSYMFAGTKNVPEIICKWNKNSVKDKNYMFFEAQNVPERVREWYTSINTSMCRI